MEYKFLIYLTATVSTDDRDKALINLKKNIEEMDEDELKDQLHYIDNLNFIEKTENDMIICDLPKHFYEFDKGEY